MAGPRSFNDMKSIAQKPLITFSSIFPKYMFPDNIIAFDMIVVDSMFGSLTNRNGTQLERRAPSHEMD